VLPATTVQDHAVKFLLSLSRAIDAVSLRVGRLVMWLVLAAVLISAGNATMRKAFNISSNAYLEIQWYLFAAVFLLGAGYTLMRNEHVRIDAISHRWSRRTQVWIDIVGMVVFLLPLCWWITSMSLPIVIRAYQIGEMSTNAGGLIRWPVYLMMPLGFILLGIQVISELIKRVAFLQGIAPDPAITAKEQTPEERLLEEMRRADALRHTEALRREQREVEAIRAPETSRRAEEDPR
jgi:TRAP-type mannitol/chloroaromatic compound transport system permease small subunit